MKDGFLDPQVLRRLGGFGAVVAAWAGLGVDSGGQSTMEAAAQGIRGAGLAAWRLL